ncbi:MAG: universal stress protein [Bacteroidia bacterium]
MIRNILVPTDFSHNAEKALKYALNICGRTGAKIFLLNSFHSVHSSAYSSANTIEKEAEAANGYSLKYLKRQMNKLDQNSKIPVEYISTGNELLSEILEQVKEKNIDLIVMGTQGMNSRLGGRIFGTNTSWVVEKAECPVIAIPEKGTHKAIKNIVYATEYLESDIENMKEIAELSGLFTSHVKVLHIAQRDDADERKKLAEYEGLVKKQISYPDISFHIMEGTNVEDSLEAYVKINEVDLLVMSAQQRDLFDKVFGKSITRIMAIFTSVPLLVFHHTVKR